MSMRTPDTPADTTKFQVRLLALIAAAPEPPKGTALCDELADYYDEEIHHGRLYPNLDALVAAGYVEKGEQDRRTNYYALTDAGRDALSAEVGWVNDRLNASVTPTRV